MSKDSKPSASRNDARSQARAMREKALKAEARRGKVILFSIVGAVTVLAVVVVLFIVNNATNSGVLTYPRGTTNYSLTVPTATAKKANAPKVEIYVDYQCPFCQQFETTNGATLKQLAADGDIELVYHIRSFLGDYSKRAANAAACVYNENPDNFIKFTELLYTNQPSESLPDNQKPQARDLLALAQQAGAGDITNCISTNQYLTWVNNGDEAANAVANSTPTVLYNGARVEGDQYSALMSDPTALTTMVSGTLGTDVAVDPAATPADPAATPALTGQSTATPAATTPAATTPAAPAATTPAQ